MDLKELATMYRDSADKCRESLAALEKRLATSPMSNTERFRLRREACLLSGMVRDTVSIANYLENYYERKMVYGKQEVLDAGSGIPGSSAVYQAGRFL